MSKPTVDEMRDYVAGCFGWSRPTSADPFWSRVAVRTTVKHSDDHPLPCTLDAISEALPPGWRWIDIAAFAANDTWEAWACEKIGVEREMATANTEKEARLRAVYAAWRRVKGEA